MVKKTNVALIYDFDETLSNGYMQDFCLIPAFGMSPKTFWKKANNWSKQQEADQITGSMYYVLKTAKEKGIDLTHGFLENCGTNIEYFPGVIDWFARINEYGHKLNLNIEHYLLSSGYDEILTGTEIRKYFKDVFACSYAFDSNGLPVWPARVINYSIKVQFISKINKGLKKVDDVAVNEFMPDDDFKLNTVAQLVPGFCRRWVYGNAVYHAGIIVPTNDHVYSSSNMGYNQNLVIWRNRKPFAVYEIDRKFDISDIAAEERNITVQGKNGEKQKFDFQQENTNPVKIDGGY